MGYKMKGSPAKMGMIQGTAGYKSAVKQKAMHPGEDPGPLKQDKTKQTSGDVRSKPQVEISAPTAPAKHLGHTPWTKSDHTVADHAKAFVKDPIGTTKKVVKQTVKKVKKGSNPLKHLVGKHGAGPGKHERSDHKDKAKMKKTKLVKNMIKRDAMKDEGKSVEDSRKMRRVQNKINKSMGSRVRHKKNILTGKYKRKIVD